MSKDCKSKIKWSGCWEKRKGRSICRWMISWVERENLIVGAIAGYSGGGGFQLEKFSIQNTDKIYISANTDLSKILSQDLIACTEDCQDIILLYHEENQWYEADTLYLIKDREVELIKFDDCLVSGTKMPVKFKGIFNSIGLITLPSTETFE